MLIVTEGGGEFERCRCDPDIIGRNGFAIGFQTNTNFSAVTDCDFGDRLDFSNQQVFCEPILVTAPVARLAYAIVVLPKTIAGTTRREASAKAGRQTRFTSAHAESAFVSRIRSDLPRSRLQTLRP